MVTIDVIRKEVAVTGASPVGQSPVRALLGGVELPDLQLSRTYLGPLDLVLYQQLGLGFEDVPAALRSHLLGASVVRAGGGQVGTVAEFEDPLQPVLLPLVKITPRRWPPPAAIWVWQQTVPLAEIIPGLEVVLLLAEEEVEGTVTDGPAHRPFFGPAFQAMAAQARFQGALTDLMHGAPVVRRADRTALVGMLIGTQAAGGTTLTNIYPLSALGQGGI